MSNVSCQFCDCVRFFFENGTISRGVAIQAESFISQNRENARDYGELFEILDSKNDKRLFSFHSVDVSLFLEFCFSNGLQNLESIAVLFMKWAKTVSRGIASKIVELRRLRGESAYFGRLYYSDSAFTILCELAYGSTDWEIHRIQSFHHETAKITISRQRENGMFEECESTRTVFILNNEIQCRNTKRSQLIERDFLKCENSLVVVTPTGDVVIPCKREREIVNGIPKMRIVEIEPTFSFLRLFLTVVSNSFFVMELGPQNRKADMMAAEHRDARQSRKVEHEEEIDVVLNSENFSEQEKNIAKAMIETVGNQFENGTLSFAMFRQTGSSAMFQLFYENFCAFANTKPHKDHFRKMVKNFKRHVRRYFDLD